MKKTKVIIVDDSLTIRELFSSILSSDPEIEVLATATDPYDAREKIKSLNPDVITLDVEMPKMDGITFLEKIMTLRPMPVVMISTLTQKGADVTFRALELGAVDYIPKPTQNVEKEINNIKDELIQKVKSAARAKIGNKPKRSTEKVAPILLPINIDKNKIIAIGASTGGVEALTDILTIMPKDCPPIVITQHMPPLFTNNFANRLDKLCNIRVHEAKNGQVLENGNAYIAEGGKHLEFERKSAKYCCLIKDGPLVSGHKPSVDVMFCSVADVMGKNAVGVILTGMGKDGTVGMMRMKNAGCHNIGQDEKSCLVYGMPKAAYLAGAVDEQIPLSEISSAILRACTHTERAANVR